MRIFQQYEEEIFRMAYVYVKNQEDALDVVQEVAYQSFKKIHTLRQPEYLKTWLIKITINCSSNVLKKNKKVVEFKPEFEEFIGSSDEDVSLSLLLQDVIETLREEEKSIVLLRFYQDYTFQEIADVLNIPLGTAKTLLYRALNKLRKEVREVDICE